MMLAPRRLLTAELDGHRISIALTRTISVYEGRTVVLKSSTVIAVFSFDDQARAYLQSQSRLFSELMAIPSQSVFFLKSPAKLYRILKQKKSG
jgi:hypothetical protein